MQHIPRTTSTFENDRDLLCHEILTDVDTDDDDDNDALVTQAMTVTLERFRRLCYTVRLLSNAGFRRRSSQYTFGSGITKQACARDVHKRDQSYLQAQSPLKKKYVWLRFSEGNIRWLHKEPARDFGRPNGAVAGHRTRPWEVSSETDASSLVDDMQFMDVIETLDESAVMELWAACTTSTAQCKALSDVVHDL
jgi:hypothetical protein